MIYRINYLLLLSLLSLLSISCGQFIRKDPRQTTTTNIIFKSIIEEFERDFGVNIGDVPINFETINTDQAGYCRKYVSGHHEIKINTHAWDKYSLLGRHGKYLQKRLIYHELGHCHHSMNLGHVDSTDRIMHPYILDIVDYILDDDYEDYETPWNNMVNKMYNYWKSK